MEYQKLNFHFTLAISFLKNYAFTLIFFHLYHWSHYNYSHVLRLLSTSNCFVALPHPQLLPSLVSLHLYHWNSSCSSFLVTWSIKLGCGINDCGLGDTAWVTFLQDCGLGSNCPIAFPRFHLLSAVVSMSCD